MHAHMCMYTYFALYYSKLGTIQEEETTWPAALDIIC